MHAGPMTAIVIARAVITRGVAIKYLIGVRDKKNKDFMAF